MANVDKRVPVTVLTGFLGAGKTTLLNHILKSPDHGMKFAIIENEFGAVGVDEKLLHNQDAKMEEKEEIIEVMNGCICCTVRGDLVITLKKLYQRVQDFDGVLIETTGMADPAPVAQTFFVDEYISQYYVLDGIITVVDAKHLLQHLDEEKPEGVENESQEQIAFADRIILNKCDLVDESSVTGTTAVAMEECTETSVKGSKVVINNDTAKPHAGVLENIEKRIKDINPHAQIVRATYSQVHPKHLLKIKGFSLDRVLEMDPEFLKPEGAEHGHDEAVSSVSCSLPGFELNIAKLNRWISMLMGEMGNDLYRYKGVLAVKSCKEKYVFQGVHMLFSGGFASEMTGSEGAGFWAENEMRECRFVFIGKNVKQLHGDRILKEFKECAAEENLRFKVGDMVEARIERGWASAKVIKIWDEGRPYRLELQDREKTNIWGPIDMDLCVRAAQS